MSNQMHATPEALELYSLGRLTEPDASRLEEHLLICAECQERLEEEDTYARTLKAALRERVEPGVSRPGVSSPRFGWRWPSLALLATAPVAALVFMIMFTVRAPQAPQELQLLAQRGPEQQNSRARAGSLLKLRLDTTELGSLAAYRIEVVNSAGDPVWSERVAASGNSLVAALNRRLANGQYWVRLYDPDRSGNALREFGLTVE